MIDSLREVLILFCHNFVYIKHRITSYIADDLIYLKYEALHLVVKCNPNVIADLAETTGGSRKFRCKIPSNQFADTVRSGSPGDIFTVSGVIRGEKSWSWSGAARRPEIAITPDSIQKQ